MHRRAGWFLALCLALALPLALGACSEEDGQPDSAEDTTMDEGAGEAPAEDAGGADEGAESDADEAADDGAADDEAAGPPAELKAEVVAHYADIVHASYADSLAAAEEMSAAIETFLADPGEESLAAAKASWIAAREVYGPTEAYRFYGGPIDNEADGPEGQMNAWPMDEAYVDYVEGDPEAGIINQPEDHPEISPEVLAELNEQGGETNVATGWHAIEFLLWGQDLSEDGPGARPASDFVVGEADNAERRRAYLEAAVDLLLQDLGNMVEAWSPAVEDNYRAQFLAEDPDRAVEKILTGIGSLAGAELAGERMYVAYESREQEDEHSCFSDNTHADLVGNAVGVQMVYMGRYGDLVGPGLSELVAAVDPELDAQIRQQLSDSVAAVEAIPQPFDQRLTESDDAPGRVALLEAVESLETVTESLARAAGALGLQINLG